MGRGLFCALLVLLLPACAQSDETKQNMALACQTTSCVCLPDGPRLFRTVEPGPALWRQNGDAYCPEGQTLRREGEKSDFVKKYGG